MLADQPKKAPTESTPWADNVGFTKPIKPVFLVVLAILSLAHFSTFLSFQEGYLGEVEKAASLQYLAPEEREQQQIVKSEVVESFPEEELERGNNVQAESVPLLLKEGLAPKKIAEPKAIKPLPPGETERRKFVPIIWVNGTAEPIDGAVFRSMIDNHEWLKTYINWHNKMRSEYPEQEILENPNAPPVIIHCKGSKVFHGGLHDRLGKLEMLMNYAFQQKRLLLFKWYGQALENFFTPNLYNWTLPSSSSSERIEKMCTKKKKWAINVTEKVFLINQINNEWRGNLELPLAWHSTFSPSDLVRREIDKASADLGLIPGKYHAIHCRVRHPAHYGRKFNSEVDRVGLNFTGEERSLAINTAIRAIQCSNWLTSLEGDQKMAPAYFFADSEDLVHTVIGNKAKDILEATVQNLSAHSRVVGRLNQVPISHLGDHLNRSVESYASTFVDTYLAAGARCVTMGVGRFSYLAAKISGTKCQSRHEEIEKKIQRHWGMHDLSDEVPYCNLSNPIDSQYRHH